MSWLVKSLTCKSEDLNVDPWGPCRKQSMVVGIRSPGNGEVGGGDRVSELDGRLTYWVKCQARETLSQTRSERKGPEA